MSLISKCPTIADVLWERAKDNSNGPRAAMLWLNSKGKEVMNWSYRDLHEEASACAKRLQSLGVEAGDRVLLVHPPSLEFSAALFGCFYAGAIPVPVYPPDPRDLGDPSLASQVGGNRLARLNTYLKICGNCKPALCLTTREYWFAVKASKLLSYGRSFLRVIMLVKQKISKSLI